MDITKLSSSDIESLSWVELKKLGKENGVSHRKKVDIIEALQEIIWERNDDSSIIQMKSSGNAAKKRRGILNDISDVTGNSSEPPSKLHCNKIVGDTLGSSLFSEFENSLLAVSSTPSTKTVTLPETPSEDGGNKLSMMSSSIANYEERIGNFINRFAASAKPILNEIERHRVELGNNKCEGEKYLKQILCRKLDEKEKELRSVYSKEIEQLKNESELIKIKCREQEKIISKKTEQNEEQVEELNRKCEQLSEKEFNIIELEEELERKSAELSKQIELTKSIELSVKSTTIEDVEDEFTCIICQELFLNAKTVPCGHSFCEICLRTWFKTKKTCPVCRRDIKLKVISSVTLDSAVEKLLENMDEETKRKRLQLKRERNEQIRREDALPDAQGIRVMFHKAGDIQTTQNPNRANTNRRRSRSQSPAARAQQQRPNQHGGGNNSNHWRNNNFQFNANAVPFQLNTTNRYNVRCFRCGGQGHVASHCTRR